MRPSSLRSSSPKDLDYNEELEKRRKSYISEIQEVMAKLKGGSLKNWDKRDITFDIIDTIVDAGIVSRVECCKHLLDVMNIETKSNNNMNLDTTSNNNE